ncbi:TonB-dependent receptor [Daejeonella lutea]|uniref:Iron complex outermembrane recepter protein n=1 Tax=Daejeonella lutea TaxID=572036 RepID=A0A1T5EY17_9SPHI|nr:TonB-dependent receptor [Daejeonella lutea]SKB88791.1 iron complex outermembrane recepter protein [Daejeonella lutea]
MNIRSKYFRSRAIITTVFLASVGSVFSQTKVDSIQKMDEIVVRGYITEQAILKVPSSVSVISSKALRDQPGISMLPAFNTIAGIRMEERSPGSYRLSIRGSLLRSPFGVRNVKVYIDDFPLTDAGGNTYLNSLDVGSINNIEILKGPDGSLFGANSGGVVLLNPFDKRSDSSWASANITSGSYGLFQEKVALQKKWNNNYLNVNHSYQTSDGYREHSSMQRHYGQVGYRWNYSNASQLRFLALYSDLDYQTPGGLTTAQYAANPKLARPSTPAVAGPVAQKARIDNKTFFGGVVNETKLTSNFRHVLALFGSHTDFLNPFITNYEVRSEGTLGLRTYFELAGNGKKALTWKWNAGLELQGTNADIANYDNNRGVRGNSQAQDDIISRQFFYFTRFSANIGERLTAEVAASFNYYKYEFDKDVKTATSHSVRKFDPQLMPRFALSYQVSDGVAFRTSVSRGYSTPTIAEVRASDNKINTNLESETGWNYEGGIRLRDRTDRFWLDASLFNYRLESAIVRRVNADDTEFYLNAGGTKQTGFETQASYWLIHPGSKGFISGLQLQNSYTLSKYYFRSYVNGAANYSGNRLTGVPRGVVISGIDLRMDKNFYLFAQHNYTSKIPLNDANSLYSGEYNLIHFKAGWRRSTPGKPGLDFFAGVDNLLDENYSLGNDLNAFGGRYFNAAPRRNFFGGLRIIL